MTLCFFSGIGSTSGGEAMISQVAEGRRELKNNHSGDYSIQLEPFQRLSISDRVMEPVTLKK